MKKIISVISVLVLTVALLTGCMGDTNKVQLHNDGTGTYTSKISFDMAAMGMNNEDANEMVRDLKEELDTDIYKVYKEVKNNKTYVMVSTTIDFSQTSELVEILKDAGYSGIYVLDNGNGIRFKAGIANIIAESGLVYPKDSVDTGAILELAKSENMAKGTFTESSITLDKDIIKVSNGGTISPNKRTATFKFKDEANLYPEIMVSAASENRAPKYKGATNGSTYTSPRTLIANDESGIKSFSYTKNGGSTVYKFENGSLLKKNGTYNFKIKDYYNNTTTFKVTIKDVKAPTLSDVKNGGVYRSTRYIYPDDAFGIAKATLSRNGGTAVKQNNLECITVAKTGYYTLKVTDINGNLKKVSFRVDKVKPTVTGVKNGYKYKKAVTVKFKDNHKVKSAKINGNSFKSGKKISKKGTYKVVVKDVAGNTRTVKFTIK